VPLHVDVRGSGPPLVVLHGFTQTGRLWGHFGELLAESHTLVAVDLPGHGDSGSVRADLPTTAGLVAEAVRNEVGAEACALLGYSLGARVGLHVALGADLALRGVVFIGVTAGIEDFDEREQRRRSDDTMADDLEASGDVEHFIDAWLRGPLFERLDANDTAQRSERLRNTAPGLASSLRLCGTGTQEPMWDLLPTLASPILAMAGTDDTRFAAHALRMTRLVPHGVASLVPGGGHAVHLAQPEQASRIVCHWLDTFEAGPT
jgi:2-succinyl-6-hydroxy-2,4-cyclohexadiene-1-carboxylate synthase